MPAKFIVCPRWFWFTFEMCHVNKTESRLPLDDQSDALVFQNLSITNPHQNGPDPTYHDSAAVACMRGGGGSAPIGNIQFSGVNIAVTNGKVDRYFNFADGSSKGIEKMVFAPGNLSGAAQVPPNGLIQSAGFSTVNQ